MEPEAIPLPADFAEKTQRNARVSDRFDELTREGKHGFYETMFRIVHEEVARERERCARVCERDDFYGSALQHAIAAAIRSGTAPAKGSAGSGAYAKVIITSASEPGGSGTAPAQEE